MLICNAPAVLSQSSQSETCPLCANEGHFYIENFFKCTECSGIFRSSQQHLQPAAEKQRYEKHQNDVYNAQYRQFVSPITDAILNVHTPVQKGLDFGAGTGPVISKVLEERGYNIVPYDPYFHDYPQRLNTKYDYIACCEVIEHFYHPAQEFKLLQALLEPKGCLYCMTRIYNDTISFEDWFYKNDPTHVFFYQEATFQWIKQNLGFSQLEIEHNLIKLTN